MPKPIPSNYETFDALTVAADGAVTFLAAKPLSDKPGFDAYLVPWYVLSDRGTFFVRGAFKKTADRKLGTAPHLWQHDTWEPIGKHAAAFEDKIGFRISVEVNEGTHRGAELMSNLRFGVPLGVSVGFDPLKDRAGTDEDDALLDRRTAPSYFHDVPISELRAITLAEWWESSTVTFAGIGTAKPDTIHAQQIDLITSLLTAIRDGTATPAQLAHVEALVTAFEEASPGSGTVPAPDDLSARRNHKQEIAARLAAYTARLAQEQTA